MIKKTIEKDLQTSGMRAKYQEKQILNNNVMKPTIIKFITGVIT